ncbi:MAG: hypothetical protein LAN62_06020 [Acidobacteriia bacterium]|nr:hypothetical protein [Terriglobia bacterium]
MKRERFARSAIGLAVLVILWTAALAAQAASEGTPSAAPAFLPEELASQIRQLQAALAETRAEMARAREESAELRREVSATREQLALLSQKLTERPAALQAENAPAAGPDEGGGGSQQSSNQDVAQRLGHVEEEQQLLGAKINEQYQTKVESASKYRVRLSGIVLLNLFANRGQVDNQDLPTLARPRTAFDSAGDFGGTVRQSQLGLEVFGPTLAGARTTADVQFDFFGGFPNAPDGVVAGLVRMRTARVSLDWKTTSVVAGQDAPFFSPLSPASLASLAAPALSYSGNLWVWTPQVRVERRVALSDTSHLAFQVGILDPLTGEPPYAQSYRYAQAGERGRQPAYAARAAWSRTAWGQTLALGAGGYYSRQDWGFGRNVDGWAGTADWSIPLGPWFSLAGEFYWGRALGGLGGGTGRSAIFSGNLTDPQTSVLGLDTVGGWSQFKFKPTERLEFNTAFGEDVPFDRDLERFSNSTSYADPTINRNQSGFVNVIYRARSNILFGAEYRRLWTSHIYASKVSADHVNLSVGVLF